MNLLIDIGNTKISIYVKKSENEYDKVNINSKNNSKIIEELDIITSKFIYKKVLISSVVPDVEVLIYSYFKNKQANVHLLNYRDFPKFINYLDDNYHKMGCDRVIVDYAATKKYGSNCMIIDLGTALTIDVIVNNTYFNGYIFPGIELNKKILIEGTTLLDDFTFGKLNDTNMCLDTYSQLNDGIILGTIGVIRVYIQENIQHFKKEPFVIVLTGGTLYFLEKYIGIKKLENILGYKIMVDHRLMQFGLENAIQEL